jgi:hypothetical protein
MKARHFFVYMPFLTFFLNYLKKMKTCNLKIIIQKPLLYYLLSRFVFLHSKIIKVH